MVQIYTVLYRLSKITARTREWCRKWKIHHKELGGRQSCAALYLLILNSDISRKGNWTQKVSSKNNPLRIKLIIITIIIIKLILKLLVLAYLENVHSLPLKKFHFPAEDSTSKCGFVPNQDKLKGLLTVLGNARLFTPEKAVCFGFFSSFLYIFFYFHGGEGVESLILGLASSIYRIYK